MSSARIASPGFAPIRLTLVGAVADLHRRDEAKGAGAWRDPIELGRSLGLTRAATISQVNRAEALGLIERKEIVSGERVILSDLGWKLFGLDDPRAKGVTNAQALPIVEGQPPLVQLLIHWPAAVAQVEALANHLGRDVEAFWDEVLEVGRSGDVETWPDHPAGPAVMLSAMASDQLGLSLSSDGTRWLRSHDNDTTSIERPWEAAWHSPIIGEAALGGDPDESRIFDQVPDSEAIEALEAMELFEAGERALADLVDRWNDPEQGRLKVFDHKPTVEEIWDSTGRPMVVLLEPKLLLGQRLTWPVADQADGPCPGCQGQRLGARTYCLVCSRSGLDDVISVSP